MSYNKKITIFYIALIVLIVIFLLTGRVSGRIQHKFVYMRFGEPVYCFVINDKLHEAGYIQYDKYNIGDYYKQEITR